MPQPLPLADSAGAGAETDVGTGGTGSTSDNGLTHCRCRRCRQVGKIGKWPPRLRQARRGGGNTSSASSFKGVPGMGTAQPAGFTQELPTGGTERPQSEHRHCCSFLNMTTCEQQHLLGSSLGMLLMVRDESSTHCTAGRSA